MTAFIWSMLCAGVLGLFALAVRFIEGQRNEPNPSREDEE